MIGILFVQTLLHDQAFPAYSIRFIYKNKISKLLSFFPSNKNLARLTGSGVKLLLGNLIK